MHITVGSQAAMYRLPSFRRGHVTDHDVWGASEVEGADSCIMSQEIMDAFEESSREEGVATLNDLLTIKLSHMPYDIFWFKHVSDYLVFKKYGGVVNKKLYTLLQEHWKEKHNNKSFLSLYRTKDSFFDDFVKKEVDHDELHKLVAFPFAPLYVECLMDGQEVFVDKEKFFSLPYSQQVKMFREEINVIMLERWLIPTKERGTITFRDAYSRSVHKTVTRLTKGWACTFMCENIEEFLKPNRNEVGHALSILGILV